MLDEVIIATTNQNKVKEMIGYLSHFFKNVYSLKDVGINIDIEETGKTFKENSHIKAKTISSLISKPIIADDSGLSIDELDGFPGIFSARFLEDKSYEDKCLAILEKMKDITNRKASFTCAITYIDENRNIDETFIGKCDGAILKEYKKAEYGFGYDPIFYSCEAKDCFGNLPKEEKFRYSHRGKALHLLSDFLKETYK